MQAAMRRALTLFFSVGQDAPRGCHRLPVRIISMRLACFALAFLLCARALPAAQYVPVDDLSLGPAEIPRARAHFRKARAPRGMPQRDPSVGKWVSPPREYLAAGEPRRPAGIGLALEQTGSGDAAATGKARAGVRLFGTVDAGKPLSTLPDWLDVIRRNEQSPIFRDEKHLNRQGTWADLRQKARGLSRLDQLRLVNSFWNRWPYREDIVNWGRQDYWEIPAEFLEKSGDCEDYAIVKYYTLKELGFDPRSMRLVVLRDTVRNLAHAVLAVYMDGDAYILDNLSNSVRSHRFMTNYQPQYSVNEFGRWMHFRTRASRRGK